MENNDNKKRLSNLQSAEELRGKKSGSTAGKGGKKQEQQFQKPSAYWVVQVNSLLHTSRACRAPSLPRAGRGKPFHSY